MSPEENPNTEDLTPTNDPPVDVDGVVVAIPQNMLQVRVVPVPEVIGVKEEEDPTKRLVVKYDPFMQVVNGLAGSNNGASRRISEILHKAVDRDAPGQFAQAIEQANIDGQEVGRQAAVANYAVEVAALNDEVERAKKTVQEDTEKLENALEEASKEEEILKEQIEDYKDTIDELNARVATLESQLAESRKPPAQRAKRNDKDES